ncbi:Peptidase family M28 [Lutibacter oricola]|uniref:Peptidase family M28 n=1 Tax=Lutibacter oricola TaxID=762486 RepID=A0A1H2WAW4_9FLAO|nr:M28 family metallopeptidase [Lutibacter oricola]SDW77665.1 Peptidase family M28 [Lutibacter oricola]
MKHTILILLSYLFFSCASNNNNTLHTPISLETESETAIKYANTIKKSELKEHLFIIASDKFNGRLTGEPGQKLTSEYLKNFYIANTIKSPYGEGDYYQEIATEFLNPSLKPSENVLAFIEGTTKANEIIVISAHLDHLGEKNGEIYNGADDNGSGTAAIMEMAQAFKQATLDGNGPKRSILFLHVTGEEKGLLGSKYYSNHPVFPLEKTVANLNIDMIGRVDDAHENNPEFIYLIGSDKLSTDLHQISEAVNKKFTNLFLDYRYNSDNDPNRYYYRSDHYNFAKNNIPVIFYFNGTHQDYHEPSDTPDKINYDLLAKRTKLIFYTTWELANREQRITLNN